MVRKSRILRFGGPHQRAEDFRASADNRQAFQKLNRKYPKLELCITRLNHSKIHDFADLLPLVLLYNGWAERADCTALLYAPGIRI